MTMIELLTEAIKILSFETSDILPGTSREYVYAICEYKDADQPAHRSVQSDWSLCCDTA